jgi:hypothetical protein
MPLLKDTEREQLRQLVKACLLEISKLKVELKKCQNESLKSKSTENIQLKAVKDEVQKQLKEKNVEVKEVKIELQKQLKGKNEEIKQLKTVLNEKNALIADLEVDLERIKTYFEALTEKPKKDLTSFQSQIYQLLPQGESTENDLYSHIYNVGFRELSTENFTHALKNLERKGYFKSKNNNGEILWEKIDR